MSESKPTIEEQIKALAWLRNGWNGDNSEQAITAFNTLDNGGVFRVLDEATEYDIRPVISTQSAMNGKIYRSDGSVLPVPASTGTDEESDVAVCTYQVGGGYHSPPEHCELDVKDGEEYCPEHKALAEADSRLDPAEWGDTTREDMAAHQGATR